MRMDAADKAASEKVVADEEAAEKIAAEEATPRFGGGDSDGEEPVDPTEEELTCARWYKIGEFRDDPPRRSKETAAEADDEVLTD